MVIPVPPVLGHAAHLFEAAKDIAIQNLCAVRSVKAFDISVLRRLAGLDELQFNALLPGPLGERLTDEFRTIVCPYPSRLAAHLHQFGQGTDHPCSR